MLDVIKIHTRQFFSSAMITLFFYGSGLLAAIGGSGQTTGCVPHKFELSMIL
jgi:hypothetical protein